MRGITRLAFMTLRPVVAVRSVWRKEGGAGSLETTCRTALVAVAALLVCHCVACRSGVTDAAPRPTAVKVATIDRTGARATTRYSAQIEPATRLDLAFKVGGYVYAILNVKGVDRKPRILQAGDEVRAGVKLASLRCNDYVQKLREAEAAYAQAKASAEQAELDLARAAKLAANGSISPAELDAARIKQEGAKASLEGAKVRIDEAQTSLSDTIIRSPFDGIVLGRAIEVGTLASPGTVGFSVAVVARVKAVFGVPDTVLPRVHLGASHVVTTAAFPNVRFAGQITRISPAADTKSRVFEVELTIPNEGLRLRSGMVVSLVMTDDTGAPVKGEPLVPLAAIVRSPAQPNRFGVFVIESINGKDVARARDVELGEYLGGVIPTTAGLHGGERIVVQGAGLLSDGEGVEVIP